MNYEQAKNACGQVRNDIGCEHPLIAPDETLSEIPDPNQPIGILCKQKLREGYPQDQDFCTVYDGSPCPLGFDEEALKTIGNRSTGS